MRSSFSIWHLPGAHPNAIQDPGASIGKRKADWQSSHLLIIFNGLFPAGYVSIL